jgi:hypothetical protein
VLLGGEFGEPEVEDGLGLHLTIQSKSPNFKPFA